MVLKKRVGMSSALGRPHRHSSECYICAEAAGVYISMNYREPQAYVVKNAPQSSCAFSWTQRSCCITVA